MSFPGPSRLDCRSHGRVSSRCACSSSHSVTSLQLSGVPCPGTRTPASSMKRNRHTGRRSSAAMCALRQGAMSLPRSVISLRAAFCSDLRLFLTRSSSALTCTAIDVARASNSTTRLLTRVKRAGALDNVHVVTSLLISPLRRVNVWVKVSTQRAISGGAVACVT